MNQSVGPSQIHKGAKAAEAADRARAHFAFAQGIEQSLACMLSPILLSRCSRQDEAALAPVDLDHLDRHYLVNHGGQAGEPLFLVQAMGEARDLRRGHKAPDLVYRDHQAALVVANDGPFPDLSRVGQFLGAYPGLLLPGHEQRKQQIPFLILRTQDVYRDLAAHAQFGQRLFAHTLHVSVGDDSIPLGPDVDDDLLLANREDDACADLAPLGSLIVPILDRDAAHLGHLIRIF